MFGVTHLMYCDLIDIFGEMLTITAGRIKGPGCPRVPNFGELPFNPFLLHPPLNSSPTPKKETALWGVWGVLWQRPCVENTSCTAQELSKLFRSHGLGGGRCVLV